MKGIILVAGKGSRLYPITEVIPKPLIPCYNKPLMYYSISTLLKLNINDILIIVSPTHKELFEKQLGDGSKFGEGIHFQYAIQETPKGIADAFIIGEEFIGTDNVCLMLGDNIFDIENIDSLSTAINDTLNGGNTEGVVLAQKVDNPQKYGVLEFDINNDIISIEEKPQSPKSNYIIPGLYFYSSKVVDVAKSLTPSNRGELEITDVNSCFLNQGKLKAIFLPNTTKWFDVGAVEDFYLATQYVERHPSLGCLEYTAMEKGYLSLNQYNDFIQQYKNSYGTMLQQLLRTKECIIYSYTNGKI